MKGISTILATILIVIIVVALVSLTYTFAVGLFSTASHGATTGTTEVTTRLGKTVTFAASSCTGATDIVKFTLQHTGTVDIIGGDMAAFLDGSPAAFTNSTGTPITSIGLSAGKFSNEFNFTTTGAHKTSRIITVATPAGSMDQPVTCSGS
jgi:FlaG/FlaF family flagellin (archaellin)